MSRTAAVAWVTAKSILVASFVFSQAAHSEPADVERGRWYWSSNCADCHVKTGTTVTTPWLTKPFMRASASLVSYDLTSAWAGNDAAFKGRLDDVAGAMTGLANSTGTERADVLAYLTAVRDSPPISSAVSIPTTAQSKSSRGTFTLGVENHRGESATYDVRLLSGDGVSMTTVAPTCEGAATSGAPRSCTLEVPLTFAPSSVDPSASSTPVRLVIEVQPRWGTVASPDEGDGAPRQPMTARKQYPFSATAVPALHITPFQTPGSSRATFEFVTNTTTPTVTQQIRINDNVGDRVRICKLSETTFDGFGNYSIEAAGSTASGNCLSLPTAAAITPANKRPIDLTVRFDPQGSNSPLNARLSIARVDDLGNILPDSETVFALKGNNGALIRFEPTSLFVGTEVDVDGSTGPSTQDATLKIQNRGNQVLQFAAVPADRFLLRLGNEVVASDGSVVDCRATVRQPPSLATEYPIVSNNCSAQLPAFDGSNVAASECAITFRFDPAGQGLRCAVLTVNAQDMAPQAVILAGRGKFGPRLAVLKGTVELPSPTALDFTTQLLDDSIPYPPQTLFLRNVGSLSSGALTISLPASTTVPGFEFAASGDCESLLPYDDTAATPSQCVVSIRFRPAALQSYQGIFVIGSQPASGGAAAAPFRLAVQGIGSDIAPVLRWYQEDGTTEIGNHSHSFGLVRSESACPSCSFTAVLRNSGPGDAQINLINLLGVDASQFSASSSCAGRTFISPNSPGCTVVFRFQPTVMGLKSSLVQVASTGSGPDSLLLSGEFIPTGGANAPELAIAPISSFEATSVGSSSLPVEVVLSNRGASSLQVLGIAVSGPFEVVGSTCPATPITLSPGQACRVSVAFEPVAVGEATGTLEFLTDASGGPTRVQLLAVGEDRADLSSGGCSLVDTATREDPTLWMLLLLAIIVLVCRRRPAIHKRRDVR